MKPAALALLVCACGGGAGDDVAPDAAADLARPDFAAPEDLATPPDFAVPPPTGPDYAGCNGAALDLTQLASATINFGGGLGKMYQPQCAIVQIGEPVVWMGDFTIDPLAMASTNAAKVTPAVVSPMQESVTFTKPGYYGYYSTQHGSDGGVGMAGLVRVVQ
jgi:plastocyanin